MRDCVFADNDTAVNTLSGISVVYGSVFHKCGRAYGGTIPPISDFNCFWECPPGIVGGVRHRALAGWHEATGQDGESLTADPHFVRPVRGDYRLAGDSPGRGRGYLWAAVGVGEISGAGRTASSLTVEDVAVALATPTTATVTWKTRGEKSTVLFRYGPEANRLDRTIERTVGQYYDSIHDLTLYDLQPSTTYYYQVGSAPRAYLFWDHIEPAGQGAGVVVWDPIIRSFTTPGDYHPKRRTFYLSAACGSDANDGLSREKPLASLYRVSRVVEPGDRVIIGGGEYFGVLQPVNSGLPGAPIVFEAAPGERVELSGKRLTQPWSVVVFDKRHLVFRGFVFKEHSKMLQDDIGGGAQVMIGNSRDILVENCLFDGRMYYMQDTWIFQSGEVVFRNNLIYPSSNSASVIIGMNEGPVVFDHNTFMQTLGATSPIDARNNADVTFTNNIFGCISK